jgi:hypothetical protein
MERTLSYWTHDDDRLLMEEPTTAFRLTLRGEQGQEELGVTAGRRVRVELRDDSGHLLDFLTYEVLPAEPGRALGHRGK